MKLWDYQGRIFAAEDKISAIKKVPGYKRPQLFKLREITTVTDKDGNLYRVQLLPDLSGCGSEPE